MCLSLKVSDFRHFVSVLVVDFLDFVYKNKKKKKQTEEDFKIIIKKKTKKKLNDVIKLFEYRCF